MAFASFIVVIIAFAEYTFKLLLSGIQRIGFRAFAHSILEEMSQIGSNSTKLKNRLSRQSSKVRKFKNGLVNGSQLIGFLILLHSFNIASYTVSQNKDSNNQFCFLFTRNTNYMQLFHNT